MAGDLMVVIFNPCFAT